jgi:hypothetical protein
MNPLLAVLIAALAAFGAAQPVLAQESAAPAAEAAQQQPPEPSLEALELAQTLSDLTGTRRTYDTLLPNIADRAKTTFIRANPQMQLGIIDVVDKVALELVERRAELDRELARVWAIAFTEDELKELIAFYETETGKKLSSRHSKILALQMAQADRWAQAISAEMAQKVREQLQTEVRSEAQSLQGAAPAAPAAPAQ